MQITDAGPEGRPYIEAYGPGGFRIDGRRVEGSVLVLPERAVDWPVRQAAGLGPGDFGLLLDVAADVDILLIGCGPSAVLPSAALRQTLRQAGIVPEPMDTGAACRTYNVLVAEGRQVAAALIAL